MAAAIGTATIRSQSRKLDGPHFGFDLRIGLTDDEPETMTREKLDRLGKAEADLVTAIKLRKAEGLELR